MTKTSTLPVRVGVFSRAAQADQAVERLVAAGFEKDHITVICPTCSPHRFGDVDEKEPAGAHTPAAAVGGGAIGLVLGGLVAVAGITATGGLGLLAAGPLLAGMGGGAVAGGLVGAMMTRGVEKELANFYQQAVLNGQILVAAEDHGADRERTLAKAAQVLADAGAQPLPMSEG